MGRRGEPGQRSAAIGATGSEGSGSGSGREGRGELPHECAQVRQGEAVEEAVRRRSCLPVASCRPELASKVHFHGK